ncbi:Gfo/Idh/MocA family oxidoreductase [Halobacteria archaeon AArc-m2/3/4]|uniref:Gfo/Idh/MocA family oxidoreductase n=1 Tax=Natronoglomus mannanivorans TaxID=2979990 RepID=A0ABT2QFY9_9EURY|nr:Gfo/Idh/MocA family oxidoreductase [Halobacteria archaeon AArc-m2/3/4]
MTRIALVGAGGMAGVYADRIDAIDGADVVAVASPSSAESFVDERVPSATAYADHEQLCANEAVDAVAVLTPTHTHREIVADVAERGIDVICEKPLARTLEDARAIREAVEASGITFMTAHAVRFFPQYAEAKARVDDGAVGEPGVARTKRAFGYEGARGWFDDVEKSGGVLLDLAIHDFDYLRWLLGDVEHVFTRHTDWSREGTSEVSHSLVRFESGAVGHVEAWWIEVPTIPFTEAFEIAGDEGHIEYDIDEVAPIEHYGMEATSAPRDPVGDDLPLRKDGYYRQLEHFLDCLETGSEPLVSVEEGIESMRLSLAAIESAERGEPVAPAEVSDR